MKEYRMDEVFVTEVIICTKQRRGNGIDDPIRVITEIFTMEGELIAEYDPIRTTTRPDQMPDPLGRTWSADELSR